MRLNLATGCSLTGAGFMARDKIEWTHQCTHFPLFLSASPSYLGLATRSQFVFIAKHGVLSLLHGRPFNYDPMLTKRELTRILDNPLLLETGASDRIRRVDATVKGALCKARCTRRSILSSNGGATRSFSRGRFHAIDSLRRGW